MVSYDVISLFRCIPTTEAILTIHKRFLLDNHPPKEQPYHRPQSSPCWTSWLNTTYFQYRESFYRQKHGCATGSPVSPIVANLYMEEVEHRALSFFSGTVPSHWFRYVDDTWVNIQTRELEVFSAHLNKTNIIKFTCEDVKENSLAFLDWADKMVGDRNLSIEFYSKPKNTNQYLRFDSQQPLEHKLGVMKKLHHRAKEVPTTTQGTKKEQEHLKTALRRCGYPDWAFSNTSRKQNPKKDEDRNKRHSISMPYLFGVSEKFRRVLQKH